LPRILKEARFDAQGRTAGMAQYWIPKIKDSGLDRPAMMVAWQGWLEPLRSPPPDRHDLARQLSEMVLFDLLLNNPDRVSGTNMVSSTDDLTLFFLDNTMSFNSPHSGHPKVRALLDRVGQFPRSVVDKMRGLTFESVEAELAGEPARVYQILTADEIRGLLRRRDVAIAHIDALIARYGEDKVLTF
jgi:hypothetical protein